MKGPHLAPQGVSKVFILIENAMYRTLLEDVWLSDIGRMAEVRNVPHLACKV